MREIRLSGSEGGGTGNSTGPPYPYPTSAAGAGAGRARDGGWVRLLVVGGRSGRWSVRGGVPTLERGNDQTINAPQNSLS